MPSENTPAYPLQELCDAFRLGRLDCWSARGGTRNAVCVLHTSSGAWIARQRHPDFCAKDRLRFDHACARHLAARGAAVLPPREGPGGRTWWRFADHIWEVHAYVEGRTMRENDVADARGLGEALARFHQAGMDFMPRFEKMGLRGETDPADLLRKIDVLATHSPACARAAKRYRPWVEAAAETLPDARYREQPQVLGHGDIQPGNVLFAEESRVLAFIDIDWCAWQPRIYDLAFAIAFCCATHAEPFDPADIWSLTQRPCVRASLREAFLSAYTAAMPPLAATERAALDAQILLSWCHARIFGAFKVPEEQRAAFLERPPRSLAPLGLQR